MTQRDLVVAAQRGSAAARENLVRAYLPLVYNVAGRALLEPHDIDDVVQETMLRVVRNLDTLRRPESVRSWILAIAVHQVGEAQRAAGARLAPLSDVPDSSADFEELAILRLRLSGQRRQVAEAGRWLDADDRTVLALWWQEAAGQIGRDELAEALDATPAYAGVRVQRMRERLERGRALVAALDGRPRCDGLAFTADGWDGQPGVLWRKRLDRHVRDCAVCLRWSADPVPIERLLAGAAMLPVPAGLLDSVLAKVSLLDPTGGVDPVSASASPAHAARGIGHVVRSNPLVSAATAGVAAVAVAGAIAAVVLPGRTTPAAQTEPLPAPASVGTAVESAPPAVPSASVALGSSPLTLTSSLPSPSPSPARVVAGCGAGLAAVWASWPMPTPESASYKDLGNGTVRDEVTCLTWQRSPASGTFTFAAAKDYCADLDLDGGGWHLPTRIELTSITDTSRDNPAINTKAFPGTPPRYFWTSSPWAVTKAPARAWIINFYESLASNSAEQTASYNVRCVRSEAGSGRPVYSISGDVVTDPATGLTWQRASSPGKLGMGAADSYCAALTLGGHDDWRLPAIQELATTVDESRVAPAVDLTAFPSTAKDDRYWSATPAAPRTSSRWQLNYDDGFTTYRDPEDGGFARCVR